MQSEPYSAEGYLTDGWKDKVDIYRKSTTAHSDALAIQEMSNWRSW